MMMRAKAVFCGTISVICVAICCAVGCSGGRGIALRLDRVADTIEKYGFASISAPFLAAPSDEFEFDLKKPADYYFDRATQPQGGVRNFSAEALDVQMAVRVNVEQALATIAQYQRARSIAAAREAQRKAGVQKQLLESLVGTGSEDPALGSALQDNPLVASTIGMLDVIANQEEPDTEALPGFVPTSQPVETEPPFELEDRIALGAVGTSFSPGLPMPEGPFQLSAREALLIASGDSTTQSLLRWFMEPSGNKLRHYELYYCPIVVSVQPGYETRSGFQADITVSVDLARPADNKEKAVEGLEYLGETFGHSSPPLQVAGIFPVVDAQVLDLANSRRQLYSAAFQLAMVGFGTQANFFLDYARKLEQDAQTQTALTTASAYTIGGTSFGFRVEPKFVAIENLTEIKSDPGIRLESKSFPALAVLLVHRSYLRHVDDVEGKVRPTEKNAEGRKEAWHKDNQLSPMTPASEQVSAAQKSPGADDRYDFLAFRTSVRWSLVKRDWVQDRHSELKVWEVAHELDHAEEAMTAFRNGCANAPNKGQHQLWNLNSRTQTLAKLALDSQALVRVYHTEPDEEVVVHDIWPKRGWLDQTTTVSIRGDGFRGNVKSVTVGGIRCNHKVVDDGLLLVEVKPWGMPTTEFAKSAGEFAEAIQFAADIGRVSPMHPVDTFQAHESNSTASTRANDSATNAMISQEKKILDGLASLAASCQFGPDTPDKWQYFLGLVKRAQEEAANDAQKQEKAKKEATNQKKLQDLSTSWAEVVIGSARPVKVSEEGKNPYEIPGKEPMPSSLADLKLEPEGYKVGWILFEKSLPPKQTESKSSAGSLVIRRDMEGRIIGVSAGEGGVTNALPLLQLIHESLCSQDDCGHFSLELSTPGVNVSASGQAEPAKPASSNGNGR